MKQSFLKIGIYATVLLLIVSAIKLAVPGNEEQKKNMLAMLDEADATTDTSYYFIGSSRVMRGVDPVILQERLKTKRVYNLGIKSSTFLNTCMLAEYIIRKKGSKILFVELSGRKLAIPPTFQEALQHSDFSILNGKSKIIETISFADRVHLMADASNYAFTLLSLKTEFKRIAGVHEPAEKITGYDPSDANTVADTISFLRSQDLLDPAMNKPPQEEYSILIQELSELANANNTKLIFFLPVTSRRREEREQIIPVYHSLPDSMKLMYTEAFFNEITKVEYLLDINHLNRRGAEKFSGLITVPNP